MYSLSITAPCIQLNQPIAQSHVYLYDSAALNESQKTPSQCRWNGVFSESGVVSRWPGCENIVEVVRTMYRPLHMSTTA
jgi:hypothetical protein